MSTWPEGIDHSRPRRKKREKTYLAQICFKFSLLKSSSSVSICSLFWLSGWHFIAIDTVKLEMYPKLLGIHLWNKYIKNAVPRQILNTKKEQLRQNTVQNTKQWWNNATYFGQIHFSKKTHFSHASVFVWNIVLCLQSVFRVKNLYFEWKICILREKSVF